MIMASSALGAFSNLGLGSVSGSGSLLRMQWKRSEYELAFRPMHFWSSVYLHAVV